jgi:hypothetical protein
VLSCVGDHILQEFNTLFLTRFRTYKIALPPQAKPRREGGLRQIGIVLYIKNRSRIKEKKVLLLSLLVRWGARLPPFSLLLSRTKLQCTLLLRGQIHSLYFISTLYVLGGFAAV